MPVRLRPVEVSDAEALADILMQGNEAFRGLVPDKCLTFADGESAKNWRNLLSHGFADREFMLMAVDQNTNASVGYCWGSPSVSTPNFAGELRQIMILPDYQGLGIGRLMVQTVAQKLAMYDMNSMCVHVLAINPNRSFYERLDAQYISEYLYDWEGFVTISYIYGWTDTSSLLSAI